MPLSSRKKALSAALGTVGRQLLTLLFVLCVLAGCETKSDRPEPARSASVENDINPAAARFLTQAQQAFQRDAYQTALALSDSAAGYASDSPELYYLRGNIYSELHRLNQARTAFEKALALEPDYRGAWFHLGNLSFRQAKYRAAVAFYRNEQEAHPDPAVLVHAGRAYDRLGKADSARLHLQQALQLDSSYAPAYIQLGQLHETAGEFEKALQHTQRALELNPTSVSYQYLTGRLLLRNGHVDQAVGYFQEVIERQPGHYRAHHSMVQALGQLGDQEAAQHYMARADSLQQIQSKIDEARRLAKMFPEEPRRWFALAQLQRRSGRYEEAEQSYQMTLSLDPENAFLKNGLANLALIRGDTTKAVHRYHAVLQQDSTFVDAWFNLGVIYARSGNIEKARQAWEKVVHYEPDHSAARSYLARFQRSP